MNAKKLISIVIPAFNEEANISELIKRLSIVMDDKREYVFEIIVVENGSTDQTLPELLKARKKEKRLKILQLARNATCDGGIIAGLSYAAGDAAVVMMADLQDIPEAIPLFLKKWEEGNPIVYAQIKKRTKIPFYKEIGTILFYKLMTFLTNGMLHENVSDFKLLDRKVYRLVLSLPEHNKFFRGIVTWTGYKEVGIPLERPRRFAGESKADIKTLFTVAFNGIFSFSFLPLRLSWIISCLLFLSALFFFIRGSLGEGVLLILFFMMSLLISIQGEYLLRIFEDTRNRPHFIVSNRYGLDEKK